MTIDQLLNDKTKKTKEKVQEISNWILEGSIQLDELIVFAEKSKDSEKASCIEAMEFSTRQNPKIADEALLSFMTKALDEKAPRIKWESAKVIANIAASFPTKLDKVIDRLLANSEHSGTVVRWATAFALGEILKLKTEHNKELLPAVEKICHNEENNGVKKQYLEAIKKINK